MARRPMCKTCSAYIKCGDGSVTCEYSGHKIDANSFPLYEDGQCYERRQKQKLTPEELSRARAIAGRKGGTRKRGRVAKKQIQVNLADYEVFSAYASRHLKQTIVAAFHAVAKSILSGHPELKPDGWKE